MIMSIIPFLKYLWPVACLKNLRWLLFIFLESLLKKSCKEFYIPSYVLKTENSVAKICSVFLIDWEGNRYASGDMYFYAYENLQVMFQYMSLEARKLSMLIAPARSSSSFGIVHHHTTKR